MTAIETYFIGPTNTLGRRIVAVACATRQRIVLPVLTDWTSDDKAHETAAQSLAYQYEWQGTWVRGNGLNGKIIWVWTGRLPIQPHILSQTFFVAAVNP